MAFSEPLKAAVRKRAHFKCCLCQSIGVEIHHIEPQEDGGADTEDNAAPLCPSCHDTYGANPVKRKFIRETRDHWYEICAARYATDPDRLDQLTSQILSEFQGIRELLQQRTDAPVTKEASAEIHVSASVRASAEVVKATQEKPEAAPEDFPDETVTLPRAELDSLHKLVEILFNQVVSAHFAGIQHFEWLIGLDRQDARWPLLLAEEYVHFLKAFKGSQEMNIRLIETTAKEVTRLVESVNLDKVEQGIRELSKICKISEEMMQPILDDLQYVRERS